jgi:hypothetical protein
LFAVLFGPFDGDNAIDRGEKGVISADVYIVARQKSCAALADENAACGHLLTGKAFYA